MPCPRHWQPEALHPHDMVMHLPQVPSRGLGVLVQKASRELDPPTHLCLWISLWFWKQGVWQGCADGAVAYFVTPHPSCSRSLPQLSWQPMHCQCTRNVLQGRRVESFWLWHIILSQLIRSLSTGQLAPCFLAACSRITLGWDTKLLRRAGRSVALILTKQREEGTQSGRKVAMSIPPALQAISWSPQSDRKTN